MKIDTMMQHYLLDPDASANLADIASAYPELSLDWKTPIDTTVEALWEYSRQDIEYTRVVGTIEAWRVRQVAQARRAERAYIEDGILPLALETRWEHQP